ncbi:MAG: PASTA domain-containing protein [Solirubrobacteraceae bacterium]
MGENPVVRGRWLVRGLVVIGAAWFAGPAGASTSAGMVAAVNAQRAANRIPAGIGQSASLTQGCAGLDNYEHLNGDNFAHSEDPSKPGYTSLGNMIARSWPVLGIDGGGSVSGFDGLFEFGPSHLFSLLDPRLSVMGADDSVFQEGSILVEEICATTKIGYLRPAPAGTTVYTYPGDGAAVYPVEEASELPSTPGQTVGLPANAVTGPYLLVFAEGPFDPSAVSLVGAALTGPQGAVSVDFVTHKRAGGGFVIPTSPLQDNSTYHARVTLTVNRTTVVHSWSFTTNSLLSQAGGATGNGTTTQTGHLSCVVPKLAGKNLARAKTLLARAHCRLGKVRKPKPTRGKTSPKLIVARSTPRPGTRLPAGARVNLTLKQAPKH